MEIARQSQASGDGQVSIKCIKSVYKTNNRLLSKMSWSEPRKNHQSSDKRNQRVSTTGLKTSPKEFIHSEAEQIIQPQKQCPYHFGEPTHVCMECRRSICLRCAITYCQQHTIHPEQQILPLLLVDLQKLTIEPRHENIQFQLKQSEERQEYLSSKINRILEQIEHNFHHLKVMLDRKKEQILQYYQEELAEKYLGEFKRYDEQLLERRKWIQEIGQIAPSCTSIEQLDHLAQIIKRHSLSRTKKEIKPANVTLGKQKIKLGKVWSEEKLEKILLQIENISYKIKDQSNSMNSTAKKKRVTTQASQTHKVSPFTVNPKSPFAGILKSTSNSRFPTGRKIEA